MAVVEICRRLDGLPLAIELAAARTRLLEPAALLARLEHVLDGLGTGPIDLPERQRTLRATVEWSVELLDDPQRRLLATLSVFADGWTIGAAANVSEETEDDTLDLLEALAGHSLVSVDASDAAPRFRMLTVVRELAAERLADDASRARVEERHAAYFAALVQGQDLPAERQTEWAERLLKEDENVRTAVRWFFTHDVAPLPHLFRKLWLFWQMNDRMPEGRTWIDELRMRLEQLDEQARAEVLFAWAVTACAVGDDETALAAMHGIEQLRTSPDDVDLPYDLHVAMAWLLPIIGDLDGALRWAAAALQGYREQNEPFMALAAMTVGMLEMSLGRDDAASPLLLEVEHMGKLVQNTWLSSTARTQLANIAVRAGRLEEAHDLLVATVDSIESANVSTLTATLALVAYARLALAAGDAQQAATALGAVDELRRRTGLLAWPIVRQGEQELTVRLAERADPDLIAKGRAIGATLDRHDALALVRNREWVDSALPAVSRESARSGTRTSKTEPSRDVDDHHVEETTLVARGIATAVAPEGGLTDLQAEVLAALTSALTGVPLNYRALEPLGPDELADVLAGRDAVSRSRIVHHMVLGELMLRPIPVEVAHRVAMFSDALGVTDDFVRVARRYAQGAFGLAWMDLQRNGFVRHISEASGQHPSDRATATVDPFGPPKEDRELAARWQAFGVLPEGTLGRSVWELYDTRGFGFPGTDGGAGAYLAQHDFVHVLADYGTNLKGEVEVFAFIGRADPDPKGFAWIATLIGLFESGYISSTGFFDRDVRERSARAPGMPHRIADAMRRGKVVCEHYGSDLFDVDYHQLAGRPVVEVRELLGVPPKSHEAVAAGSAGLFDVDGMSENQRRFAAQRRGDHS
jgi:hypothetical protein